jgi:hypothetical protein
MAGRSLGALLLVGALIAALLRGAAEAAPWSLDAITTPELTPEALKQALPPTFADVALQPAEVADQAPSFATAREILRYADPDDPAAVAVIVTIDTLAEGVGAAGALATLSDENAIAKPRWEIEEQDLSPEAAVPYLLASEENIDGSTFWSVSWGHRDGGYLFTVAARSAEEREAFVQALTEGFAQVGQAEGLAATETAVAESDESFAAQATAVAQTAEAQVGRAAALDATAAALATGAADLAAREAALAETAAAVASEEARLGAAATAAAATQAAPGPEATIAALETEVAVQAAALATAETANATFEARPDASPGATPISAGSATPAAIRSEPIEVVFEVDGVGLIQGDEADEEAAIDALEVGLAPLAEAGCRIGFVIAEASAPERTQGEAIAATVNELLATEFPDLAAEAGLYGFADVPGTPGEVALLLFPNEGCPIV